MVSENVLVEEASLCRETEKTTERVVVSHTERDPSDKNFWHKDQFQFLLNTYTQTTNKGFPESLQFKKYLVVDVQ